MTCYICRQTGAKSCEPHCGLCEESRHEERGTRSEESLNDELTFAQLGMNGLSAADYL